MRICVHTSWPISGWACLESAVQAELGLYLYVLFCTKLCLHFHGWFTCFLLGHTTRYVTTHDATMVHFGAVNQAGRWIRHQMSWDWNEHREAAVAHKSIGNDPMGQFTHRRKCRVVGGGGDEIIKMISPPPPPLPDIFACEFTQQ